MPSGVRRETDGTARPLSNIVEVSSQATESLAIEQQQPLTTLERNEHRSQRGGLDRDHRRNERSRDCAVRRRASESSLPSPPAHRRKGSKTHGRPNELADPLEQPFDASVEPLRPLHHVAKPLPAAMIPVTRLDVPGPEESDFQLAPAVAAASSSDVLSRPELKPVKQLSLAIDASSALYTGGSTIDGQVSIDISAEKSSMWHRSAPVLAVMDVTLELIGAAMSDGRQHVFHHQSEQLVDFARPPPRHMILDPIPNGDGSWNLVPSHTSLPFRLQLPLSVGPPPFRSRHASIKYMLSATVRVRHDRKLLVCRVSREATILTAQDGTSTS